jgi:hypothetical protein
MLVRRHGEPFIRGARAGDFVSGALMGDPERNQNFSFIAAV